MPKPKPHHKRLPDLEKQRLLVSASLDSRNWLSLQDGSLNDKTLWLNHNKISQGILLAETKAELKELWKDVNWNKAPKAFEILVASGSPNALTSAPLNWAALLRTPTPAQPHPEDDVQLLSLFFSDEPTQLATFLWGVSPSRNDARPTHFEEIRSNFVKHVLLAIPPNTPIPSYVTLKSHARLFDVALAGSGWCEVDAMLPDVSWDKEQATQTAFVLACMRSRLAHQELGVQAKSTLNKICQSLTHSPIDWSAPFHVGSGRLICSGLDGDTKRCVPLASLMLLGLSDTKPHPSSSNWSDKLADHIFSQMGNCPPDVVDKVALSWAQGCLNLATSPAQALYATKTLKRFLPHMSSTGAKDCLNTWLGADTSKGLGSEIRSYLINDPAFNLERFWFAIAREKSFHGLLGEDAAVAILRRLALHSPVSVRNRASEVWVSMWSLVQQLPNLFEPVIKNSLENALDNMQESLDKHYKKHSNVLNEASAVDLCWQMEVEGFNKVRPSTRPRVM